MNTKPAAMHQVFCLTASHNSQTKFSHIGGSPSLLRQGNTTQKNERTYPCYNRDIHLQTAFVQHYQRNASSPPTKKQLPLYTYT